MSPSHARAPEGSPPGAAAVDPDALQAAVGRACARIAPAWPLDRFIAVNPFWGMADRPLPEVAARLHALSGASLLPPRATYREALRDGRLRDAHLAAAIARAGAPLSVAGLRARCERSEPVAGLRARVADVADEGRDLSHRLSWRGFITHSVSQVCAAYFDEGQALLGPDREGGLYRTWWRQARVDRGPELLMGAPGHRARVAELPDTAAALIPAAVAALGVPASELDDYLWGLLLDQNGWASYAAYLRWTARLRGGDDAGIEEILAIRLAWEWLVLRAGGGALARRWRHAMALWPRADAEAAAARPDDWLLQEALELAWQEPLVQALAGRGGAAARPAAPAVQAIFCIDVRSEVFRRALETVAPDVQTLGFAGFFGLPVEYAPLGAPAARPQLPGLLVPRLRVADAGLDSGDARARARRLDVGAAWDALRADALSAFAFVEAVGLGYAGKLVRDSLGLATSESADVAGLSPAARARRKPRLADGADGGALSAEALGELAESMLRAMSLTHDFAPIVLLAGHGSSSRNNPHAAGLDCGACCGQSGEVNARAAAALLNAPEVRAELARRGISVPETTWFVAGLHDTTTDDVTLFDLDEVPARRREDVARLTAWLREAGGRARPERAPRLGVTERDPERLARALRARAADWGQVRPEWGLADNAGFIAAPRERCRHLDLGGRVFLHEYRHEEDRDGRVLELILTAPVLVAHWINFQYYASTVDPARYGSGNKVLHNVVGGHLGVFEGNGGDLRIGLPWQCVHDGQRLVHTPLRLSVFVAAPRGAIDAVLARHAHVRSLVTLGWVHLLQIDDGPGPVHAFRDGRWQPW